MSRTERLVTALILAFLWVMVFLAASLTARAII